MVGVAAGRLECVAADVMNTRQEVLDHVGGEGMEGRLVSKQAVDEGGVGGSPFGYLS